MIGKKWLKLKKLKKKENQKGKKRKKNLLREKKEPNRGLEPRTSRLLSVRTTTMLIRLDSRQ